MTTETFSKSSTPKTGNTINYNDILKTTSIDKFPYLDVSKHLFSKDILSNISVNKSSNITIYDKSLFSVMNAAPWIGFIAMIFSCIILPGFTVMAILDKFERDLLSLILFSCFTFIYFCVIFSILHIFFHYKIVLCDDKIIFSSSVFHHEEVHADNLTACRFEYQMKARTGVLTYDYHVYNRTPYKVYKVFHTDILEDAQKLTFTLNYIARRSSQCKRQNTDSTSNLQ